MNIERRKVFRHLAAIPLAIAGVAVAKHASAQESTSTSIQSAPSSMPQTPPLDTRSPREVWEDQDKNYNQWLDGVVNDSQNYRTWHRQINHVSGRTYLKLKDRLITKGLKPEELVMGGDTFLVIHGNLYTIGQWW